MLDNKEEIKEVLDNGGVIAYVTDTVWGLGCLPENEKGVKKIYEIKHREAQKPLILMSNEAYNLLEYVRQPLSKTASRLIKKYFPGALTLVVEKSSKTPDFVTSGMNTVGIRVPENEYFVLGDNRINSTDSRIIGTISKKDIKGRTSFTIYPFSRFGKKE